MSGDKKMMIRSIVGVLLGAGLGFLYYKFVGCRTGTCPIVRNPYTSIVYGAVMGFLFASSFK